MLLLRNKDQL